MTTEMSGGTSAPVVPAQPGAPSSSPTREDGASLVQLVTLHAQLNVSAGLDVLWRQDFPSDPYTIDTWFAPGTDGRHGLEAVLLWFQTVGTLVRHGLLHPELARDIARADLVWARISPMAMAERSRTGDETMWGGFEHLARMHAPADGIDLD